ncbi:MAG: glycosyltransferase [Longimicrobiales bacterium]
MNRRLQVNGLIDRWDWESRLGRLDFDALHALEPRIAATVSVVIPTYNRAAMLAGAVHSAVSQDHKPLEILVVDDGSTDETRKVCERFPGVVRYVYQENRGVSVARNRGLGEARGEYIAFLDSDDEWHPSKLRIQLSALAATPSAKWCITGCQVVDAAGTIKGIDGFREGFPVFRAVGLDPRAFFASDLSSFRLRLPVSEHDIFAGDAFRLLFFGNFVFPSSAIMHRSVLSEVGFFDEKFRVAGDNEYFHRVAAAFPGAIVMTPLMRYRKATDGRSLTAPTNTTRLIRNALESTQRAARLRPLSDGERKAFEWSQCELHTRLAYAHLTCLETHRAKQAIRSAWAAAGKRSIRSIGIYAATMLPRRVLWALGVLKRALRKLNEPRRVRRPASPAI